MPGERFHFISGWGACAGYEVPNPPHVHAHDRLCGGLKSLVFQGIFFLSVLDSQSFLVFREKPLDSLYSFWGFKDMHTGGCRPLCTHSWGGGAAVLPVPAWYSSVPGVGFAACEHGYL